MIERIIIQIDTGNDAFDDAPASEIARILRSLAEDYESSGGFGAAKLYDINGNCCGHVRVEES